MLQNTDTKYKEDTIGDVPIDITETALDVEVEPLPSVYPPQDTVITQSSRGDGDEIQDIFITHSSRGDGDNIQDTTTAQTSQDGTDEVGPSLPVQLANRQDPPVPTSVQAKDIDNK